MTQGWFGSWVWDLFIALPLNSAVILIDQLSYFSVETCLIILLHARPLLVWNWNYFFSFFHLMSNSVRLWSLLKGLQHKQVMNRTQDLMVAQRQTESCLQAIVGSLHFLWRYVFGAGMQGEGSAGQRQWPPGLWQSFVMSNSSRLCVYLARQILSQSVPWHSSRHGGWRRASFITQLYLSTYQCLWNAAPIWLWKILGILLTYIFKKSLFFPCEQETQLSFSFFLQSNLLASGASDSEIFIWDLNNFSVPMTPGAKSQVNKFSSVQYFCSFISQ